MCVASLIHFSVTEAEKERSDGPRLLDLIRMA